MIADEAKINEYYVDLFVKNPTTSTPHPGPDESARWAKIEVFLKRIAHETATTKTGRVLRILDVGCGRGWLTNLVSAYGEAEGVEPVAGVVNHARKCFPRLRFFVGAPQTVLKSPDFKPYDVIVSSEVIEHVSHHEQSAFVASLMRLLKPRGYVILTTPRAEAFEQFRQFYTSDQPIEDWLSEQQIASLFSEHGFHALGNDRIYLAMPDLSYVLQPTQHDHRTRHLIGIYQVWAFQSGEKQSLSMALPSRVLSGEKADPLLNVLESEQGPMRTLPQAGRCVLIVCTHFPPSVGGLETIAAQLGKSLIAKGYDVHVATERSEKREFKEYCGITIHSLDPVPLPEQRLPRAVRQLRKLILSGRYDACILLADPRNWIFWSLEGLELPEHTRIIAQPLINAEGFARWRDNRNLRTRLTQILKRAHSVVAISTGGAIVQYLTEEGIPYVYIPNAVERETGRDGFRARYGIPESVPMLLHIANLWPVKNHLGLMDALSTMDGDWRLVMIGHSSGDSQYEQQVRDAVRRDPRFILIPGLPRDEIAAALETADILLLASRGEVAPVTILEAMSHAKPWLATQECGGVHDNAGGLIVPIEQFPQALSWLVQNSHVLQRLGRLGYEHWSQCFRWDAVIEAWDSLIKTGASSAAFAMPPRVSKDMHLIRNEILQGVHCSLAPAAPALASRSPMVSVIVPTYNRPDSLVDAMRSILNQTYQDFEIIVVNDAGSDVENIVRFLDRDGKITYIRHGSNRDRAAARNTAIKVARGKYIAYLDDDDIYYPDHLETLVEYLQKMGLKVAYTDALRAHQEKQDGRYVVTKRDLPYSFDFDYDRILVHNFIPILCLMHEKGCLDVVGLLDESLTTHEDWDLLIRLSKRFQIAHIKKVTCEFVSRTDGSTTTSAKLPDFRRTMAIVLERHMASASEKPHVRAAQERILHRLQGGSGGAHVVTQPTESQRIAALLQQADTHCKAGDLQGAKEMLGQAIDILPDNPQLLVTMGNVVLRLGDVEGARREFVKATVLHPDYAPAHVDLAAVLLHLDRSTEAEVSARRALELESTNVSALKVLAKVCFDTERYQDAVQAYATILGLAPNDIETLILVGNCYAETGRSEDAKTFYRRVLQLDPNNVIATENLTVVSGNTPSLERADGIRREASERKAVQVSIIIPVFNRLDLTRRCLEAVRRNTPTGEYELIVVDNGSSDGTSEFLRRQRDAGKLRAILNSENEGFARACNQGARAAAGTYLLFLNNDTEVQPGWFEPLVRILNADSTVGAVGSKLLYPNGLIQHAGVVVINDLRNYNEIFARHIYYRCPADLPEANLSKTYQALTAACLLMRRSVFEQVQGYDEDYWNGYEDVDLCLKIQECGWLMVYEPRSRVIHHESQSGAERFRRERDNVKQLWQKWSGRVVPDLIIQPDGSIADNGANRVRSYQLPTCLGKSATADNQAPAEAHVIDKVAEVLQCVEMYMKNGNLEAASQVLTEAIAQTPDNPDLIVASGHVAWKQGDLEKARVQFVRAATLDPNHVQAHAALAILFLQQSRFAEAEEAARKALAINAAEVTALKVLAKICLDTERYQEAVQTYVTILQHAPNDIETLILVGNCYAETSRFEQARGFYQRVLALDPSNAVAGDNLAEVNRLASAADRTASEPIAPAASEGFASVSIVIVTYNSASTIRACLDSVLRETRPATELIVVDNLSTDETRSILREYQDRIATILNPGNIGFSTACNKGIRASGGEYVVLLNPDTIVTPGWLDRLVGYFGPGVGAVGPVSDYAAELQNIDRHLPDGAPSRMGLPEVTDLLSQANNGKARETKLLTGFCMMVPRKVLDEVGLLDEDLFLGNDDLDLSWRLCLKGYKLFVAADTFVHHEGQVSFKSETETKTSRLVQESTDRLYAKLVAHYGPDSVPSPMELWGIDWFKPTKKSEVRSPKSEVPVRPHASRLTSIIILTHNGLEHTKKCLISIETHTPEPHELIIVDNGSTDGTLDFLRDYTAAHNNVRVVANRTNRGFAAGNNQGLALARGAYVLLLNNDTIVTDGWLRRMLAVFEAHPNVGIVGPMSNYVSGPQLVRGMSYKGPEGLDVFATEWMNSHDGQSREVTRVVGFCLLTRKEVIARIGGLDEQFGSGNFEDDDFCIRAFQVGFRARIAADVFIHHSGSQTFKVAKIDYRQSLMRNWELFKRKWGIPADAPYEKGYRFPPQSASDVPPLVPLPDVNADHQCNGDGRWRPESSGEPVQPFDKDLDPSRPAVTEDARLNIIVVPNGHGLAPLWPSLVKHTNYPLAITISPSSRNSNSADLAHEGVCPKGWLVKTGELPGVRVLNRLIQSTDDNPVILLSGNLIMTPGWLKRMLAALKCNQGLAAVGPTSNRGVALQRIKSDYKGTGKALRQFALRRAHRYKQQLAVTGDLASSCIVFNPAVCRSIGSLREDMDLTVSLTDYFARIEKAGHTLAVALDAYVHCE